MHPRRGLGLRRWDLLGFGCNNAPPPHPNRLLGLRLYVYDRADLGTGFLIEREVSQTPLTSSSTASSKAVYQLPIDLY